jgi:uncharacterized protein (TIGR02611 family)
MAWLKRSAVTLVGVCLVLGGIALMPLPGPGILVVVAGLAVLATEYVWARRLLRRAKAEAERAQEEAVASPLRIATTVLSALAVCGVGITMLLVEDVRWPIWDSFVDSLWSPMTGSVVVVSSIIPLVTTAVSLRSSREEGQGRREPASVTS